MDYHGNLCGMDNANNDWIPSGLAQDMESRPNLYFLDPSNLTDNICVEECPKYFDSVEEPVLYTLAYNLCDVETPMEDVVAALDAAGYDDLPGDPCVCSYDKVPESAERQCQASYRTTAIARRCFPYSETLVNNTVSSSLASSRAKDMVAKTAEDFRNGWHLIIAAGAVALVLGFLWLVITWFLAHVLVWLTIIAAVAVFCALSFYLWQEGQLRVDAAAEMNPEDEDATRNAEAVLYTSYAMMGITAVLILLVIFFFERIQIAIGIIRVAGRALGSAPMLIVVPVVLFVFIMLTFFYSMFVGSFIYSAGEVQVVDGWRREFVFDNRLKGAIAYHIFGTIWAVIFLISIGQAIIAATISEWYFTRDRGENLPMFPVAVATGRILRYHQGSLAFGSMLIAIVVMMRLFMEYVRRQVEKAGKDNKIIKFIICCMQCCLSCFQRFLEFITTNAYIEMAIFGNNFCRSAKDAWSIITSNILRVTAVSVISTFLMFLGKLFVCCTAVFVGYLLFTNNDPPITSYFLLVLVFALAYVIALLFFSVLELSIKTILVCFLHDDDDKRRSAEYVPFAPDELDDYIAENTKKPKKDKKSKVAPKEEENSK